MKIFIPVIVVVLLSSCCVLTSQDCNCEPPPPEFLTEEVEEWLSPYNDGGVLFFQDSLGNLDSLITELEADTGFIGGDECGNDSEIERAVFQSATEPVILFTLIANSVNLITLNNAADDDFYISLDYNTLDNSITTRNDFVTSSFDPAFEWRGEPTSVLIAECEFSCRNLLMSRIVVSRELGLLTYTDIEGVEWIRIN